MDSAPHDHSHPLAGDPSRRGRAVPPARPDHLVDAARIWSRLPHQSNRTGHLLATVYRGRCGARHRIFDPSELSPATRAADRAGADGAFSALFFEASPIDWLDQGASIAWKSAPSPPPSRSGEPRAGVCRCLWPSREGRWPRATSRHTARWRASPSSWRCGNTRRGRDPPARPSVRLSRGRSRHSRHTRTEWGKGWRGGGGGGAG